MDKIKFNYRNRQSQAIKVNISSDEIKKFEEDYKTKIKAKYQDRLVLPAVEVIISDDGLKILDTHITADGKLEEIL
jgi:hypothetical protein